MAENNAGDSGFEQIRPTAIELGPHRATGSPGPAEKRSNKGLFLGLGLALLFITAALVIFLLPDLVEPPDLDTGRAIAANASAPISPARSAQSARPAAESPWEQAQQSKLRKETQEILAQILEAQKALENNGVTVWAAADYARAIEHAKAGDRLYNQRDFAAARTAYQAAMQVLEALMEQVDEVFQTALEEGQQALEAGDTPAALASFQVALAIDAIDREANIGHQRAQSLDQVNALIDRGDELLGAGQLQQAKASYNEALEIDARSSRAAGQVQLVDKKILAREFNHKMSLGFAALEEKRYREARSAFSAALRLRPGSPAARSAINQTEHSISTLNIKALLADAKTLEAQERWREALSKYEAALTRNANLAAAQQGQERTTIRSAIHDRLERILASPQRLYDEAVHAETLSLHKKLRALANPGPILRRQLDKLEQQLAKAKTPVTVRLQSDNLTKVILYRVGELGYFLDKQIDIPPGPYVAVGQRAGYKDIRVEFMAEPDKPAITLTVQAQEKIALK